MLPKGYLDMDRADYAGLDVPTLRAIYKELRDIVRYTMGKEDVDKALDANRPETPIDWIMAIKRVTCRCERCKASGIYYWGACINGKMTHSGPCYRCESKGWMNFADMRRCRAYDNHAICRAVR